jgi:DnaJ-class molecular chaperone
VNFDKIRKAYLKASLRYHPDKAARHGFTEAEATDAMQVREWRVDLDLTL